MIAVYYYDSIAFIYSQSDIRLWQGFSTYGFIDPQPSFSTTPHFLSTPLIIYNNNKHYQCHNIL